jgi:hypothetical protein
VFQVQAGGSFDIDYTVKDHAGKVVLDGEKERQGDFVFTAQTAGEYSFCFSNDMSTFAEKVVDFEITVRHPLPPSPFKFVTVMLDLRGACFEANVEKD